MAVNSANSISEKRERGRDIASKLPKIIISISILTFLLAVVDHTHISPIHRRRDSSQTSLPYSEVQKKTLTSRIQLRKFTLPFTQKYCVVKPWIFHL
ncbi:hypothetical protein Avbf_10277 [Armadillidium vulgare]|nr:hypothetical protein Avbf_10277 [Armadillidium vulgare]